MSGVFFAMAAPLGDAKEGFVPEFRQQSSTAAVGPR